MAVTKIFKSASSLSMPTRPHIPYPIHSTCYFWVTIANCHHLFGLHSLYYWYINNNNTIFLHQTTATLRSLPYVAFPTLPPLTPAFHFCHQPLYRPYAHSHFQSTSAHHFHTPHQTPIPTTYIQS